jgi:Fe-S cluster biogenesis protein NfuA
LEQGNFAVDESLILNTKKIEDKADIAFDSLDEKSQRIVNILEEYIKPAVQADGGNIAFQQYDTNTNTVHVLLQGACSGCPSSTFTLKNGIENMLKQMLQDNSILVEAYNG